MKKIKKYEDCSRNVSVEAELGSLALGDHSNEHKAKERFTNPNEAMEFVKETNVDALAISIGTVHGMYKGEPNINLEVLRDIKKIVDKPLVLHGGSGTPEDKLRECIDLGIRKINVNTEISYFVLEQLREKLSADKNIHYSDISLYNIENISNIVSRYLDIFMN